MQVAGGAAQPRDSLQQSRQVGRRSVQRHSLAALDGPRYFVALGTNNDRPTETLVPAPFSSSVANVRATEANALTFVRISNAAPPLNSFRDRAGIVRSFAAARAQDRLSDADT
jgi:hypothetical protein